MSDSPIYAAEREEHRAAAGNPRAGIIDGTHPDDEQRGVAPGQPQTPRTEPRPDDVLEANRAETAAHYRGGSQAWTAVMAALRRVATDKAEPTFDDALLAISEQARMFGEQWRGDIAAGRA